MYLSSDSKDIIKRVRGFELVEQPATEWWLFCYLGTDEQWQYSIMYIYYLRECVMRKVDGL